MTSPDSLVISQVIGSENSTIDASMECPIYSIENSTGNSGCHKSIIEFQIEKAKILS